MGMLTSASIGGRKYRARKKAGWGMRTIILYYDYYYYIIIFYLLYLFRHFEFYVS